jgi:uncharacterized cupredoxin-like copper-binding protein
VVPPHQEMKMTTLQYSRRMLLALGSMLGVLVVSRGVAAAGTRIVVKLTDKGAAMAMPEGCGMGMGGDMAKATMGIVAAPATARAGKVTFDVTNASSDMVHEMLIAPVRDTSKPLRFIADERRVDEEASGDLGEVSELDPGQSGALTLTLRPGTYILFCNVPGHYMAGMWTLLTVGS